MKRFTRIGLFVTAIIALIIAALSERIYLIWYSFASVLVPMLLLPLTASYFPKLRPKKYMAELTMIAGGGTALIAYLIGIIQGNSIKPEYLFGIEPMYIGLIASVLVFFIGWEKSKQRSM